MKIKWIDIVWIIIAILCVAMCGLLFYWFLISGAIGAQ